MRHYEVILMIHPDKSDQINSIIENYTNIFTNAKGKIHRLEDWGRKQLAYSIKKLQKAHYVLINFESSQKTLNEFKSILQYNDFIIRSMIIRVKTSITDPSPMIKLKEDKKDRREEYTNSIVLKNNIKS